MVELISTYGLTAVILVLLIAIPAIFNFIKWCKGLWQEREKFKQQNIQKGIQIETETEKKEARLQDGEARMTKLEADVKDLKDLIATQQKLIELLIKSDELDIKSWIKMQHERWIPKGCIDSQTFDLLEQRYAVYTSEGGNSWAKKLVEELRALPTVTILPIADIHEENH